MEDEDVEHEPDCTNAAKDAVYFMRIKQDALQRMLYSRMQTLQMS